jgi:hypothetical protein
MDQKPIVLYLRMKGMALDAIHDDLVRTLGKDAVAYSTVAKYARSAQFSGRKEATFPSLQMWKAVLSMAILTDLAEFPFPFSSVREVSRRICLPRYRKNKNMYIWNINNMVLRIIHKEHNLIFHHRTGEIW